MANPYGSPGALADAQSGGGGFGQSVSISADGTVGVVGEPNHNGGAGAALVYANANGVWTPVERLEPSAEIGAGHFGAAVSMDGGGRTLIVGAPEDNGGIGSAWVFTLPDGGSWTEQAELVDTGEIAAQVAGRFGTSVAIASSGQLALVGEPLASAGTGKPVTGQAVTYEYFNGWEQWQRMHVAGVPDGAHFGASVAMPTNGGDALVGAPNAAGGDGIVYPYSFYGLGGPFWIDGTPIPSPATKGSFGASVSLSLGGDHGFVGAPHANGGDGEVYEYKPSGVREAVFNDPSGSTGGNFGATSPLPARRLTSCWSARPAITAVPARRTTSPAHTGRIGPTTVRRSIPFLGRPPATGTARRSPWPKMGPTRWSARPARAPPTALSRT